MQSLRPSRAATPPSPSERGSGRGSSWRTWLTGMLLIAALIGVVLHRAEVEGFSRLVLKAQPLWLALAFVLQLTTYGSVALGWRTVLQRAGTPRRIGPLVRVAVSKLFADQVLPSAGMGGNVVLVDRLRALGVPRGTAVAALLISMIGFYGAYALFALLMLVMLWLHDRATPLMAGLVTLFLGVAIAIPSLALWLRKRGSAPLPARIEAIGFIRHLLETVAEAPASLLADRGLLLKVMLCNAAIFLADAATLYACLHAVGQPAAVGTAFIALIMASIVVTLGPIPLGLGSFEATSTATLSLLGIPVAAAFAATMLLRLMTLWLPLVPGMLFLRRGLGSPAAARRKAMRRPRPTPSRASRSRPKNRHQGEPQSMEIIQCDSKTGHGGSSMTALVTPPRTNSRMRE